MRFLYPVFHQSAHSVPVRDVLGPFQLFFAFSSSYWAFKPTTWCFGNLGVLQSFNYVFQNGQLKHAHFIMGIIKDAHFQNLGQKNWAQ